MNKVGEAEQLLSTADVRSPGLKGLVEDALLRPDTAAYAVTIRIVLASILSSVVVMALETVHPLVDDYGGLFTWIDMILLAIFTMEYAGNIWVVPDRRKYLLSVWGIIDLLAIAPAYIELALGGIVGAIFLRQLRTLRVMRTLRVLKMLKLAADRLAVSAAQASQRRNTFGTDIQIYGICLFAVISISSSLIHLAEGVGPTVPETVSEALTAIKDFNDGKEAKPDYIDDPMLAVYAERADKSWAIPVYTYTSVPKSYWWSIVTLTTTGYGEMYPVTAPGRVVAGFTMLAGLALFSLLTSVVGRTLMTSLFGRSDDDGTVRPLVIVVGSRLPVGFDATAAAADVRGSGYREAEAVLITETSGLLPADTDDGETLGLVLTPQSGWWDRFVHAGFIHHDSGIYGPVHNLLTAMILVSVAAVVLDSVASIHEAYASLFDALELVIVAVFTVELFAQYRIATRKSHYLLSVWGLIDIFAILPTYLALVIFFAENLGIPLGIGSGLIVKGLRMLRVLRMLRALKLVKAATANMRRTMSGTESTFRADLQIYFIALFTILVISSTFIWNAEFDPLDEKSTTMFVDIPTSMWWGMVTLCTVGYGDMFPQTLVGRIIGGATMLAGLALFGILTSVIGRALMSSLFGSTDDGVTPEPEIVYIAHPLEERDGATVTEPSA